MDIYVLLVLVFALCLAFTWGKEYGRSVQRKIDALWEQAQEEKDPEKRRKLLLEWNDLTGGPLKKQLRDHLLGKKTRQRV